jgi:hypothetical protein
LASFPAIGGVRESGLDDPRLHLGLLGACVVLFATAFFFWPVLGFSLRGMQSRQNRRTALSGLISLVGWLLAATCLGFVGAFLIAVSDPEKIVYGTSRALSYALLVPQVCVGLAGVALLGSIVAWSNGYWRLSGRLHDTLVALAGVGFAWFLYYWNLLSFGAGSWS